MKFHSHSSEQRSQIAQLLEEALDELENVEDQIEALTHRQRVLHETIASYRDTLSPIRRLSRDVLQEIFIHCLPADENASLNASKVPFLLGRVCSSWRTISHSTPYLWTSLHITQSVDDPHDRLHYTRIRPVVENWLKRSGSSLPLSISMSKTAFSGLKSPLAEDRDAELDTVRLLLPFMHRCRRLSLDVSVRSIEPILELSSGTIFETLETLIIHRQSLKSAGRGGRMDFHPWSKILGSPRLRRIWIQAPYLSSKDLVLPLGQLTHLDIRVRLRRKDMNTMLLRLTDCEQLVSCTLRVDRESDHLEPLISPVQLPNLEILNVFSQSEQDLGPFFASLRLPRLRYLCCEDAQSHMLSRPLSISFLTADLPCSSSSRSPADIPSSLEGLYLQITPHVQQNVLDYLHSCPPLKHLKLAGQSPKFRFATERGPRHPDNHCFIEQLLRCLTLGEAGQINEDGQGLSLCPALETIHLEFPPVLQARGLLTFLRSRTCSPNSTLKHATFHLIGADDALLDDLNDSISEFTNCDISLSSPSTTVHDYRSGFDSQEWS
ncbi:hypothetical protein VKT23_012799 [Stygiomarasmius scandens]|uniref:F-box domain-containing protein n=1 Tax=Marasmiellus scandens TaxID=2682957 RepID=A0ABR1J5R4_9AGAR